MVSFMGLNVEINYNYESRILGKITQKMWREYIHKSKTGNQDLSTCNRKTIARDILPCLLIINPQLFISICLLI